MIRHSLLSGLAVGLTLIGACNHTSTGTPRSSEEHYFPDPNSVGFNIEPLQGDGSTRQWLATYTSQGKTAKFIVELGPAKPLDDKESRAFDIQTGNGKLVAVPGSDAITLLADLKKALEAKKLPTRPKRVSSLPFQFVTLGENLSQAVGGGFNSKPPGNWTPMKIFLGEGEQEGQVFLNLNPVIKKGQFSIKDADYGDIVLAQLAQVL